MCRNGKKCYYLRGILLGIRTPKALCHMLRMSWTFNFIPYSARRVFRLLSFSFPLLMTKIFHPLCQQEVKKLFFFVQALPVIHWSVLGFALILKPGYQKGVKHFCWNLPVYSVEIPSEYLHKVSKWQKTVLTISKKYTFFLSTEKAQKYFLYQ